jgi:DNA-binding NarL/FixJ family response regulator
MIRVLLVDDQALVRGGFRSILEGRDAVCSPTGPTTHES